MEDQTATIPTTPKPAASGVDKTALVLITMFLGGLGGHKFYLRKYGQGVLYALFFWTLIPSFIAFIEWILYLTKSQSEIDARYPGVKGNAAAVAVAIGGGFFLVVGIGILSALAVPRFMGATAKAKASECKPILKQLATLEEAYHQETGNYSTDITAIGADLPSTGNFEYRIEIDQPDHFRVKAILLKPLGNADPGDEVTYNLDEGFSVTGDLAEILPTSSTSSRHHD